MEKTLSKMGHSAMPNGRSNVGRGMVFSASEDIVPEAGLQARKEQGLVVQDVVAGASQVWIQPLRNRKERLPRKAQPLPLKESLFTKKVIRRKELIRRSDDEGEGLSGSLFESCTMQLTEVHS